MEKKPHAIEIDLIEKKKKCPKCVQLVKDKMLTLKERNVEVVHKFEEIRKTHARKRVLKDDNSEEDSDIIRERKEEEEDIQKEEKLKQEKKDKIHERKEKKKRITRAKPKIKKKPSTVRGIRLQSQKRRRLK